MGLRGQSALQLASGSGKILEFLMMAKKYWLSCRRQQAKMLMDLMHTLPMAHLGIPPMAVRVLQPH